MIIKLQKSVLFLLSNGIVIYYTDIIGIKGHYMKRNAFTMIELVFVIVVLGILAAVALPRLGGNIERAKIATGQGDVAAIRSAIASTRQKNLVKGINDYPATLHSGTGLFGAVLTYPIYAGKSGWTGTDPNYTYTIGDGRSVDFSYDDETGIFDCTHSESDCKKLVE